jgi:hypothetical protein
MRDRRPDLASLVSGLAVVLVGILLLLDDSDAIDLSFALFAPVACAATGAILVAAGLSRRE